MIMWSQKEFDRLIELAEQVKPDYKFFCTEKIKNDIQSICSIDDAFFQVIPQSFYPNEEDNKIYIIPVDNKPIKIVCESDYD